MATETYQKRLERHLADYRVRRLGVREKGTFTHNGTERAYGHILPAPLKWHNIPEAFRAEVHDYVAGRGSGLKLHRYFHHLNSSQAFALSLFWPFAKSSPTALAAALGSRTIEGLSLEHVEVEAEGTNVDVTWLTEGGRAYCEVKLSESEFGAARDDKHHQMKLGKFYGPDLKELIPEEVLQSSRFFENYQIYRNLRLAARRGHERDSVWFVLPKANDKVSAQLDAALRTVRPALRNRVHVVYVEALVEALTEDARLGWYARMLKEKYVV